MDLFAERRKYQRCCQTICKALMSVDGIRWNDIELCDISAGGLSYKSKNKYEMNTDIRFNLIVHKAMSEFNLMFEGRIISSNDKNDITKYAVKFHNTNKYTQVQLDEIIKSKISIINCPSITIEGGEYTFLLTPKRSSSIKNKMRMIK